MERQKSFLCVFRRRSQAQLCVARQGVWKKTERNRRQGKRAQGFMLPPSTYRRVRLCLGIWGQLPLLHGTALRATLEATGCDKPCVCITQMLRGGGGQTGVSVWEAEAAVSVSSPALAAAIKCCPEGLWVSRFAQTFLRRSIKCLCY